MLDPIALCCARMAHTRTALFVGGVSALVAAAVMLRAAELGLLSHHMGVHILLMNGFAPLLATVRVGRRSPLHSGAGLLAATAAQMVALWAAHLPQVQASLAHRPAAQISLHAALFILALWFWMAVVAQGGARRWRALVALLLTGKLACLLGVLLIFAPRVLYPGLTTLADQQQAGLWMVAACLLTYVVAAVVIAALWLKELGIAAARAAPARNSPRWA